MARCLRRSDNSKFFESLVDLVKTNCYSLSKSGDSLVIETTDYHPPVLEIERNLDVDEIDEDLFKIIKWLYPRKNEINGYYDVHFGIFLKGSILIEPKSYNVPALILDSKDLKKYLRQF